MGQVLLSEQAAKSLSNAVDALHRQAAHHEAEIAKAVNADKSSAIAMELRAVLRGMKDSERSSTIRAMVANKDADGLKAIAAVPAILSRG